MRKVYGKFYGKYEEIMVKIMSAADNALFTGQAGEIVILSDTLQIVTHDGILAGGRLGTLGGASTVAATGSVIGDAAALGYGANVVTGADATKGVKLPVSAAGRVILVKNNTAAVLKVWPPNATGTINAITAGSAISMASLTSAVFFTVDGVAFFTIPLLPS